MTEGTGFFGHGHARRSSRSFQAGAFASPPRPADLQQLVASAGAVLAAFEPDIDVGRLPSLQHRTLRLLEQALKAFSDRDPVTLHAGPVTPPGAGEPEAHTRRRQGGERPAADSSPGAGA